MSSKQVSCVRCNGTGNVSALRQPPFGDLPKRLSDLGHVYRLNSKELIDVIDKTSPSSPEEWQEGGRMLVQRLISEILSYEWKFQAQEKQYIELKERIVELASKIESFSLTTNEKLAALIKPKRTWRIRKIWEKLKS